MDDKSHLQCVFERIRGEIEAPLRSEIERLRKKVDDVYDAGMDGIRYVGAANWAERELEAQQKLRDIYTAK